MRASLRRFVLRLLNLWRRGRAESELAREIAAHLVILADEYERRGMNPADAAAAARRALGGVERAKDLHRDARSLRWLDDVGRDLRHALRSLRRSPGFSVTVIATIAVGVGINAAVFALMNAVLIKGFPLVERNDQIRYVTGPFGQGDLSFPDFQDWRAQATTVSDLAAVADLKVAFSDAGETPTEKVNVTRVTANTLALLGQQPRLGRDFTPDDERLGAAPVAIVSDGLWQRRYSGDPGVVGRVVRLNGVSTTIVGVMPRGFSFPQRVDLWVPLVPSPEMLRRDARGLWFAFGRLRDNASTASASREFAAIATRLASSYPETNRGDPPIVQRFDELFIGPHARLMYGSLFAAVGVVLLIVCANLANLTLARTTSRVGEISLRIALGASRWRIARQILIESALLSAVGGVFGWLIATWSLRVYQRLWVAPEWFAGVLDYSPDSRALVYLAVLSLGSSLLFGLVPALRVSRVDVNAALKDGGRTAAGPAGRKHVAAAFVAAEMALAVVLLCGAGVLIHSFMNIYTAKLGVSTDNMLVAFLNLPSDRYPTSEARTGFYTALADRLDATAGVQAAAVASSYPAGGGFAPPRAYELADRLEIDDARRPRIMTLSVSAAYFQTIGAALRSGRSFTDADGVSGPPVVIVNQRFASENWPGQHALGQRLRLYDRAVAGAWLTVVGVVPDVVQNSRDLQSASPLIYLPLGQEPRDGMWVLMRTAVPPSGLASAVRREVQTLDADLPVWSGPFVLDELLRMFYADRGQFGTLSLTFAAIALLMAVAGLYAVIAHSISQRTREIGIRMAVGASASEVLALVLRQGMLPLSVGLAIGLPASLVLNRFLQSELVGVSPFDPVTLVVVTGVLVATALIGCVIPARRAMRIDPTVALAHD